jgi:hypothetical protein
MDMELTKIHIIQDFSEQAEEYDVAASNERLWAKGANDSETAQMHEENAEHCSMMAQLYRNMAKYPEAILKLFMED